MRKRIYIAGPISKGDLGHNIDQATVAFVRLAKAGLAPFCPHWSAYSKPVARHLRPGEPPVISCVATVAGNPEMGHADWLGIDLSWVGVSHAVLRLPGESVGADQEVREATRLGLPVFYSADDVLQWAAVAA